MLHHSEIPPQPDLTLSLRYFLSLPNNIANAKHEVEHLRGRFQTALDGSWATAFQHSSGCPLLEPDSEGSTLQASRAEDFEHHFDGQVTYFGLTCTFTLDVHKWKCKHCSHTSIPQALDYCCFPSTPLIAHVWYDLRVMQLYKRLGPGEGLSATGGSKGGGGEIEGGEGV